MDNIRKNGSRASGGRVPMQPTAETAEARQWTILGKPVPELEVAEIQDSQQLEQTKARRLTGISEKTGFSWR